MSVTNRLVFDATDADSIAASSNAGAFVRSNTGELIDSQTIAATEWLQVAAALHAGNGTAITQTGGALDVFVSGIAFTYDYAEDAAHTSGEIGAFVLAVRQDALASSTSADGDYAAFKVDAAGALYVNGSGYTQPVSATAFDIRTLTQTDEVTVFQGTSPWVVSGTQIDIDNLNVTDDAVVAWLSDGAGNAISSSGGALDINIQSSDIPLTVSDIANGAIENTSKLVTTTTGVLLAAQQANRSFYYAQNLGNKDVYVGKSGVTTANGLQLSPGMIFELRLGSAVSLHGVAQSGSQDVRIMELASA